MLQQTRVSRVLQKYPAFIKKFPDFAALAAASRREILVAWQGLGYNRRALLLKQCAEIIVCEYGGVLSRDPAALTKLPGIGKATAGSIAVFAFHVPAPFIETNIRRVFIHFFFPAAEKVRDEEVLKLVEKTVDRKNPREWYYALMDYGAMLAKTIPNPNKKSALYARQPSFRGSDRELRGKILKILLQNGPVTPEKLSSVTGNDILRIRKLCDALAAEGFIQKSKRRFFI